MYKHNGLSHWILNFKFSAVSWRRRRRRSGENFVSGKYRQKNSGKVRKFGYPSITRYKVLACKCDAEGHFDPNPSGSIFAYEIKMDTQDRSQDPKDGGQTILSKLR